MSKQYLIGEVATIQQFIAFGVILEEAQQDGDVVNNAFVKDGYLHITICHSDSTISYIEVDSTGDTSTV